jgi:hypothetical protein
MASRALTARLTSAFSNWLASANVRHSPPARTVSSDTASPSVRRSKSHTPETSLFASTPLGSSGCWRAKASSRLVSFAARRTPSMAMSLPRTMRDMAGEDSITGT